eukprot:1136707-Pelagomonas_calceolata.AAC.8
MGTTQPTALDSGCTSKWAPHSPQPFKAAHTLPIKSPRTRHLPPLTSESTRLNTLSARSALPARTQASTREPREMTSGATLCCCMRSRISKPRRNWPHRPAHVSTAFHGACMLMQVIVCVCVTHVLYMLVRGGLNGEEGEELEGK